MADRVRPLVALAAKRARDARWIDGLRALAGPMEALKRARAGGSAAVKALRDGLDATLGTETADALCLGATRPAEVAERFARLCACAAALDVVAAPRVPALVSSRRSDTSRGA